LQVFFHSLLSIYLSSVDVVGRENIPTHGPVIFVGNHNNQFVDALVLVATCPHAVRFLVAKKSYDTRIIGDLSKAIGAIPGRVQTTSRVLIWARNVILSTYCFWSFPSLIHLSWVGSFAPSRLCQKRARPNPVRGV
jgi:1-acyl-sn-glycerol-3-phosphate acyltransferase